MSGIHIERTRIVVDLLVSVKEIQLAVRRRESERVGHPADPGPGVHREEVECTVPDGNAAPQRFERHSARQFRRVVGDAKEAPQIFDPDLDIELEGSVLPLPSRGASQGLGFIDPDMAAHRLPEPEDKSVKAVRIRFCHRRDSTPGSMADRERNP